MLNKKTVDDINVKGKKVLVRCDFNVPLQDGKITDENRLVAALPTIKKLIADGGKIILCSHLGKPKGEPKPELSLAPVAVRLSELLGQEVKFAADPEVVGPNAKAAVEAGVLENPHVDAAFAAHVFAAIPYGTIGYGVEAMASVYGFKITLTGRGGHGSAPEGCIDPINAGVEVYHALQALIARECPSSAEAALTIGQFTAGNAANVIPERCVLQGTLRTFNEEVRTMLIRRINEIVPAVAAAYRTTCEIEELSNVPSVTCNEELNAEYIKSVESLENPGTTINGGFHVMGSEDFAVISAKIPASYFVVGAGVEDQSKWKGQHNPKILFNEKALPLGAAMYAKIAMDWLAK